MSIFVDPKKAIEVLDLSPGMQVADVGCGVGHYTFEIAEKLNEKGRIYAIDIRKNVLDKVASEAKEKGFSIVDVIWGDAEKVGGTKIADESVDVVVASNIFFQVEDKDSLVKEFSRITKLNGKILIIEWKNSFGGLGPSEEMIVDPKEVKEYCKSCSLVFEEEHKMGTHHYELLFTKNNIV